MSAIFRKVDSPKLNSNTSEPSSLERTINVKSRSSSRMLWLGLATVVIAVVIIGAVLYYESTLASSNGTPLTLYEGEISETSYGFGNSASSLTSNPGPTIKLTSGKTYTMTVFNIGTMQHNWAIVDAKATNANVLWGAATAVENPGANVQVTFKAGSAGSYFYICQIPGHVALGLWGEVTVNP